MVPWWGLLLSVMLGYLLKGVGEVVKSKWQFQRDRAEIAKVIYQDQKAGTKETDEECVTRYKEIYELLEPVFKK